MDTLNIETIQFKRGTTASLEAWTGIPKAGEPVFDMTLGKLKIGDGIHTYSQLSYIGGSGSGTDVEGNPTGEATDDLVKIRIGETIYNISGSGGADTRFVIHDPVANQILLYDDTAKKWVNKDLADKESIVYLSERGLTLKGYDAATQGQMLVKDATNGLAWVNPVNDTQLQQAVAKSEAAASNAGNYATAAGNSAASADTSAQQATRINEQTMNWFNNKFWWGTVEEYNALESISPDTFYFITTGE